MCRQPKQGAGHSERFRAVERPSPRAQLTENVTRGVGQTPKLLHRERHNGLIRAKSTLGENRATYGEPPDLPFWTQIWAPLRHLFR